jgi:hypothetical protein
MFGKENSQCSRLVKRIVSNGVILRRGIELKETRKRMTYKIDKKAEKALRDFKQELHDYMDGRYVGDRIVISINCPIPKIEKDKFMGLEFNNEDTNFFCKDIYSIYQLPVWVKSGG